MGRTSTPRANAANPNSESRRANTLNGAVHKWYRTVLGYSEDLVSQELTLLADNAKKKIIDPFCGSGTTLVECMKHGIDCVGIDASPASYFATKVKINWNLSGSRLTELYQEVSQGYPKVARDTSALRRDPTYIYLEDSGMIERGWISLRPLWKALAIKTCIAKLRTSSKYRDALTLALIAEVTHGASNVKFGPELYCGDSRDDHDVLSGFCERVKEMTEDLELITEFKPGIAQVVLGDSRECSSVLNGLSRTRFTALITSPPYPAEHDYTRNARLELAFLEEVSDRDSLRRIKKRMIRSHTKGIYKQDCDCELVEKNKAVQGIVATLQRKVRHKDHGFARLYPKVVQEYFGGMKKHLAGVKPIVSPGARCTYIVGDQSSYLRVHIPTSEILSSVAEEIGFKTLEIRHWRKRWSTTTARELDENILVLQAPGK